MRRSCWHDGRLGLGVLLTLLAWGGVAPQIRAGCEGPTVVIWSSAENSHRDEFVALSKDMPNSSPHHSVPGRKPCSGPHCSRVPLAPPAPPATSLTVNQEWACFALLPSGADFRGSAYPLEEDPHKPIWHTFRVYHPPR